jgi:NADH-quinone oxidoreductase subunit N
MDQEAHKRFLIRKVTAMFEAPAINWYLIAPFVVVAGWGMLLMVVNLFVPDNRREWASWLTMIGLFAALVISLTQWNNGGGTFTAVGDAPMVVVDNFAVFLNVTLLIASVLSLLISFDFLKQHQFDKPEYYMLLLFSLSGMMLMGMANDLILVFLALELLSIPLYIMSGFAWPREDSEESAMKYFSAGRVFLQHFCFWHCPDLWRDRDHLFAADCGARLHGQRVGAGGGGVYPGRAGL